jgi:hypothetical protein
MALSQSPTLVITLPTASSDQKGGHPQAYNRQLLDEFTELPLKSKTQATWTHEGICTIFAQPQ